MLESSDLKDPLYLMVVLGVGLRERYERDLRTWTELGCVVR